MLQQQDKETLTTKSSASFISRRPPLPSICSSESVNNRFNNHENEDDDNGYFTKEFIKKYKAGKTKTHGLSIRQQKAEKEKSSDDEEGEEEEEEKEEDKTPKTKRTKRNLKRYVDLADSDNEDGDDDDDIDDIDEDEMDRDISFNDCIYCTYGILVNTGFDNDQDEIPEFEKTIRVFIQRTVMKVGLGFLLSEIRKLTQNEIIPFLRDKGHHNLPPITNKMIRIHFADHFIEPFLAAKFHIMELKQIQKAIKSKLFSSIRDGDIEVDKQLFDVYTKIQDMILKLCKQDPTKHIGFDENFAASTNLRVRSLLTQQGYSGGKKQKKDG